MADPFPKRVRLALADEPLQQHMHDIVVPGLHRRGPETLLGAFRPEYEKLRDVGERIRRETVDQLDSLVEQFIDRATASGIVVHRARDGEEANRIVIEIARARGVRSAVKAKSMTTEETRMNEALAAAGIEPVETDLGQLINQLAGQDPFHMVGPAIHHPRRDVATLFSRRLHSEHTEDIPSLMRIARVYMRRRFAEAGLGISGVNFGVAETGTIVVCENEGNIGLSTTLPRIHIAVMGIDKVLPRLADVAPMVKLLARAGGGFPMFRYVSMLTGKRGDGGPQEVHVVMLDNGRSEMAKDPVMRDVLRCIRCGACQAACPVYTKVGGHAYGSIYQGPIGAMVTPQLHGMPAAGHLPYASTLCGACVDVCPVRIPIPHVLLELRHRAVETRQRSILEEWAIGLWAIAMRFVWLYRSVAWISARVHRLLRGRRLPRWLPLVGAWTIGRELPPPAKQSFRRWWARTRGP